VLPVSEKTLEYGRGVADRLLAAGLRSELDDSNEKLGYKIRQAQVAKVPYMLVVGEREAAEGTVAVRLRTGEERKGLPVDRLVAWLADAAADRRRPLPDPEELAKLA
jgi:threonyl-tRNA synthetase